MVLTRVILGQGWVKMVLARRDEETVRMGRLARCKGRLGWAVSRGRHVLLSATNFSTNKRHDSKKRVLGGRG